MKSIISLVLILFALENASGLSCYHCDGLTCPEFYDNAFEDKREQFTKECSPEATGCSFAIFHDMETRECYEPTPEKEAFSKMGECVVPQEEARICLCEEDFCNLNSASANKLGILILVPFALLGFRRF